MLAGAMPSYNPPMTLLLTALLRTVAGDAPPLPQRRLADLRQERGASR